MKKRRIVATWITLLFLAITTSGCALIGTAISAGMAYGLYKATQH